MSEFHEVTSEVQPSKLFCESPQNENGRAEVNAVSAAGLETVFLKPRSSLGQSIMQDASSHDYTLLEVPAAPTLLETRTVTAATPTAIDTVENAQVNEPTESLVVVAPEETEAERAAREERESELLAWQLMQEENQQLYAMQQEYMRANSAGMSEEDLAALQAAIDESGRVDLVDASGGVRGGSTEADISGEVDGTAGGAEAAEEGDDGGEEDPWDYERLLELGQALGDVKTERWRLRAKSVIDSLPLISFAKCKQYHNAGLASTTGAGAASASTELPHKTCKKAGVTLVSDATPVAASIEASEVSEISDSNKKMCLREIDSRCAVCMEDFCDEEQLILLPCKHYFHTSCIAQWMGDHNSCPSCKTKISVTPEK